MPKWQSKQTVRSAPFVWALRASHHVPDFPKVRVVTALRSVTVVPIVGIRVVMCENGPSIIPVIENKIVIFVIYSWSVTQGKITNKQICITGIIDGPKQTKGKRDTIVICGSVCPFVLTIWIGRKVLVITDLRAVPSTNCASTTTTIVKSRKLRNLRKAGHHRYLWQK